MYNFKYSVPTTVYFGKGQICHLSEECLKYGNKLLLVYGGGVEPNPRIETVRRGVALGFNL